MCLCAPRRPGPSFGDVIQLHKDQIQDMMEMLREVCTRVCVPLVCVCLYPHTARAVRRWDCGGQEMRLVGEAEKGGDGRAYVAQVDSLLTKKLAIIQALKHKVTAALHG